ncbi:MAG: hypothetical protein ACJ758_04460 [Actinomycetota bacterium]
MSAVDAPPNEGPPRSLPSAGSLLFGALGGAAAWAVQLAILDMTVELGCMGGWPRATEYGDPTTLKIAVLVVTAIALLVTAGAWLTALTRWRAYRTTDDDPPTDRTAFLAISGLIADGLFFLLIALTGIAPLFFVGTCFRR